MEQQDISTLNSHQTILQPLKTDLNQLQCSIRESEKHRYLQEIQKLNGDLLLDDGEELMKLSASSRKMLETVLRNAQVMILPQTISQFTSLTIQVLANESQKELNIAKIVKSQIDLLRFDIKLEKLVVDVLGFSNQTRTFNRQRNEQQIHKNGQEANRQFNNSENGDIVTLSDFLIEFGKMFRVLDFSNSQLINAMDSCADNHIEKLACEDRRAIADAKKEIFSQMTHVFDETQLKYLASKEESPFLCPSQLKRRTERIESQNMEDLIAQEDMSLIQTQFAPSHFQQSNRSQQRVYPEYNGLSSLLNRAQTKLLSLKTQDSKSKEKDSNHGSQPHLVKPSPQIQNQNQIQQKPSTSLPQEIHQAQNQLQELPQPRQFEEMMSFNLQKQKSLISANNSFFNTPVKPYSRSFQTASAFKPRQSNRQLFGSENIQSFTTAESNEQQSPKFYQDSAANSGFQDDIYKHDNLSAARMLSFSANKVYPQFQAHSPLKQSNQMVGKRQRGSGLCNIEGQISKGFIDQDGFSTPAYKRQRVDPVSTVTKGSHYPRNDESLNIQNSSESEDEKDEIVASGGNEQNGEGVEGNSSASRKKRGLKILSVKVQELVQLKKSTTYKDVANELIKQLREKRRARELGQIDGGMSGDDIGSGDEDELSELGESPNRRSEREENSNSQQKWEKNVRRRVYDALNVLYAAGVLKKDGKHVSCDKSVLELTNKLKANRQRQLEQNKAPSLFSSAQKSSKSRPITVHEQRMIANIESLKAQLLIQKQMLDEKRSGLFEQFKHIVSYKNLLERNKQQQEKGIYDKKKQISLPFILIATKDCPENEVEISFGDQNKSLNIAMKKPMRCIGDADTLIKLGLYKVSEGFIKEKVQEGEQIFKCLTPSQRREILI